MHSSANVFVVQVVNTAANMRTGSPRGLDSTLECGNVGASENFIGAMRNACRRQTVSTIEEDKSASIPVPDGEKACWIGWPALIERVQHAITERCSSKPVVVVECYPSVD